jgi:hypothetical protein
MAGPPAKEAPDDPFIPLDDPVEDWEVFINFEPQFPTPSLPAVELGSGSLTQPLNSTSQNQRTLVRPHPPVICVQKPPEQNEIQCNLISIGYALLESSTAARSRALSETGPPHNSSPPAASSFISGNASLKSAKRRFDDCLSSFSSGENPSQQQRKRQAYAPERREQVAKMRKIRACQRCKMRKLTVSSLALPTIGFLFNIRQCQPTGSCDHCIKSVGSTVIGEHICVRHSLEELRFRGGGIIYPIPFVSEIADIVKIYYTRAMIGNPLRAR